MMVVVVDPPRLPAHLMDHDWSWWGTAEEAVRVLASIGLDVSLSITRATFPRDDVDDLVCRVIQAQVGNDFCIEVIDEQTIKDAYVDVVETVAKSAVLRALVGHCSREGT